MNDYILLQKVNYVESNSADHKLIHANNNFSRFHDINVYSFNYHDKKYLQLQVELYAPVVVQT